MNKNNAAKKHIPLIMIRYGKPILANTKIDIADNNKNPQQ